MNLIVKAFFSRTMSSPAKSIITIISVIIGLMVVTICMNVNYKINMLMALNTSNRIISVHSGKETENSTSYDPDLPYNKSILNNILSDIPELQSYDKVRWVSDIFSYNDVLYKTNTVIETESSFIINHDLELLAGRNISSEESGNKESLISDKIAEELFIDESPIGKFIELKDRIYHDDKEEVTYTPYQIVGTYKTPDRFTMEQRGLPQIIYKINNANENITFTFIVDTKKIEALKNRINVYLKSELGEDRTFVIWNGNIMEKRNEFSWMNDIYKMMKVFFNILAGVTLLVLCFSIFSMVMVATSERTREIGLKRALGFSKIKVIKQFFIESILFISIGIIPGIILAAMFFPQVLDGTLESIGGGMVDFSELVIYKMDIKPVITAVFVTLIAGSVLGLFPALTSVSNMPIESIKEN